MQRLQQLLDELVDAGAAGVVMHYHDQDGQWRGSSGVAELGTCEQWLPGLVPGGDGITVRQLLNHTSGLYNYTEDFPEP
jgi:D-alanyl-D-alanine carboxypeptidase